MDSRKRNLFILIALAGTWGLILVFRSPWGPSAGPEIRATQSKPLRQPAAQGGGLPRLKRELLDVPPPGYPPEVQNIFGTPPPPPPPPLPAGAAGAAGGPAPVPVGPPPPDPFQEAAKQLRYVGYLEAGQKMMAFIIQGPEVFTVEVGATISERFRIQAITEEAVLLSSPTGDKQARLPLATDAAVAPRR